MLRMTDISIKRSGVMLGSWCMEITVMTPNGEVKSTQFFDDFGGFMTAVKEAATFFAVRLGKLATKEANARFMTKPLAPNPDERVN